MDTHHSDRPFPGTPRSPFRSRPAPAPRSCGPWNIAALLSIAALLLLPALGGCLGDGVNSGQTGSIGGNACEQADECRAQAQAIVDALLEPAPQPSALVGSSCEQTSVISDLASASGPSCACHLESGRTESVGPRGLGCHATGRDGRCLFDDDDLAKLPACTPGDGTSCEAECEALLAALGEDAERSFEAEVVAASCDISACHHVVRVGERCYPDDALDRGMSYDCALDSDAIIDAYAQDTAPPDEEDLIPERTPYLEGTDGFLQLIVGHHYAGSSEEEHIFAAGAQFFTTSGESGIFGEVIDPLEGVDDCGMVRGNGTGVGPDMRFVSIDHVTLIDQGERYPFVMSPASNGDFFDYFVESLEGVEPRFGGSYGFEGGGGGFGADFKVDGVRLPEDLAFPELQGLDSIARGDIALRWTGRGEAPLHVLIWVFDDSGVSNFEVECLLMDDGAYTIGDGILDNAPGGSLTLLAMRERRVLHESGDKVLQSIARVQAEHVLELANAPDHDAEQ